MRAVVIGAYGGPEVLRLRTVPDPAIGANDVLVEVAAAGINPVDTFERAGQTKAYRPVRFPGVLGWDVSGTVVDVGAGVAGFAPGDRVLAWAYHTYAERCVVDAGLLVKVPAELDLVDAAALPLVTVTGSQLISDGADVGAGQTVLVSGANGGVGRAAVFTAKARGAHVTAGVSTRRLAEASTLGADAVVALDDAAAMAAFAPVDVVANTVRGPTAAQLFAKVRPGGCFASVTGAPAGAGHHPTVRVVPFVSKQSTATLRAMVDAVRVGRLSIPIERRLTLADAAIGHAAVEKGGVGKILLLP